jgi:hypothetical protein
VLNQRTANAGDGDCHDLLERGSAMRTIHRLTSTACMIVAATASAWAQTGIRPDEWSHGTTLSGFVGVPVESEQVGAALGGAAGWEMTPRFAVEGTGSWLDFGDGASGFAGAITLRTRLRGQRKVDPFVQAGIGMYRASFGLAATMPSFYERRTSGRPLAGDLTFTDPTVVAGGGANVFLNRRFAIRPDVLATIVFGDGRRHVITTVGVYAVYHFEDHPVTPNRRARP